MRNPATLLLCLATGLSAQVDRPPSAAQRTIPPDVQKPVTTASGLIYSVLKAGDESKPRPVRGSRVRLHYTGWTAEGKVFETSEYNTEPRRAVVGLTMLPAWTEALQLMHPGQRLKITCPPALAFGSHGLPQRNKTVPAVPPDSTVIYELVLSAVEERLDLPTLPVADPQRTEDLGGGLRVEVLEPGQGPAPREKQGFELAFHLFNADGHLVSSSVHPRTRPIRGRHLYGKAELPFLERLSSRFKVGQSLRVEVPPALCFGAEGRGHLLPPNSRTTWVVEVLRFLPVPSPKPVPEFRRLDLLKARQLPGGLRYEVLKAGSGEAKDEDGRLRFLHVAWRTDGKVFDESFSSGIPAEAQAENLVPGLRQVLQRMPEGAVWLIRVPPGLGYGLTGNPGLGIGPNRHLFYLVEYLGRVQELK